MQVGCCVLEGVLKEFVRCVSLVVYMWFQNVSYVCGAGF